jgi:uncharacterized iron-regulated membrane protein
MDSFGLIMGIVVIALGIFNLFMGMSGRWVYLKKASDESTEELKEKKTRQARRRYKIIGVIWIIVGIAVVLVSTLWVQ